MSISPQVDLKKFNRIVFFTGAGISAECGIPTYRGKGGFWSAYDYEEYACQRAFDTNPEKVWDFHEQRREFVAAREPALGHRIIADIENKKPSTKVITQNIDGMHQKAGSLNVIELHGSLWRIRCEREGLVENNYDIPLKSRLCPCGDYYRPDIVWFGDPLDPDVIKSAINAVLSCDLLIAIGTSATVYPAADLPILAMQRKITTLEINTERTPLSHLYNYSYQDTAGHVLQAMWDQRI
ncbi:MAG: Sir2 family NAD-dependent protein deacetylase [bacterium]